LAGSFIADLPQFDAMRFRMAILRTQLAHRGVESAVEVLDLVRSILRSFLGHPNAQEWLGADVLAELHDLFEPRPGGLQAAPGAERLAAIGVADRVAPVELA